jgi:putative membrane protein
VTAADGPAGPTGPGRGDAAWHRLHPLSPIVAVSRLALTIVVTLALSGIEHRHSSGGRTEVVIGAVVAVVLLVPAIVSVVVTRWRFDGEVLSITTGLLRRDSRQLPVARIQAVDLVQPLVGRMLGLAELRIRLAGAGGTRGRLAFLGEAEAGELRARLLAAHHGLDQATPEPPELRLLRVPAGRLIASVAIADVGILAIAVAATTITLALAAPQFLAAILSSASPILLALGQAVVRRVISEFGFTAAEAPDGLRVRSGLLQTSAETIPRGRVQAVRQVEPFFWRPFGWRRLEVDVAGGVANHRGGRRSGVRMTKTLLPVGSTAEADLLLARVLGVAEPALVRPPQRARWKAPLGYHFLAGGYDAAHAVTVNGRLRRTTAWVPLEKVQSVRRIQGPLQRRLALASVHLDTAGRRVHAIFRDRDAADSARLLETLATLSRAARTPEGRAPGAAPPMAAAP